MKEVNIPVTVQLGHEGATDAIVVELREQVKRRKVVKAKHLRTTETGASEKEFWQALAARANVRLLDVRGHTAVFCDLRYQTERDKKGARVRNAAAPRRS